MKILFLLLSLSWLTNNVYSQVNTIWDENNVIGIGTTNPEKELDVKGTLQLQKLKNDPATNSSILSFQINNFEGIKSYWNIQNWAGEKGSEDLTFFQDKNIPRFQINTLHGWSFLRDDNIIEMYSDNGKGIYIPELLSVGILQTGNFTSQYISSEVSQTQTLINGDTKIGLGENLNYTAKGGSTSEISAHYFTVSTPLTNQNSNIAAFANGGTVLARIDKDGNFISTKNISTSAKVNIGVGGLNTGTHSLAVNGSAIFTKALVKLSGTWPDYVFDQEYELPSLLYIESYINEHKHLPGVPSATEVAKEGIDLGENQMILLKKIEELTLYIIEQNKRIQNLEIKLGIL